MADTAIDSIKSASRFERRSKLYHLQKSGRLHKGQSFLAASASIPSKYQTIVSDNSERKGFGSCSRRFDRGHFVTEGPAPSHYQRVKESSNECVSFSKKGTGTFASKTKRFHRLRNNDTTIAPGQYNPLHRPATNFNKATCTSNFHLPIAVQRDSLKKDATPAPNQYNLPNRITGRLSYENNVAASAAFKSRSRRDLLNLGSGKGNPAPGTYNINDEITKANSRHATAPFKSKSDRNLPMNPNAFPGPGTYNPFDAISLPDRKKLPRQHYLCIAAPAMPLPPSPPPPGPGHYNLVNYQGEERKYVSSSAFVSTSNRLLEHVNRESGYEPGPATYNPQNVGKQSFIYNIDSKWI